MTDAGTIGPVSMGKKSKGKAPKPPAGTAASTAAAAPSGAGAKKQRCIRCSCILKDLAKAHACPGCHQLNGMLYCWRCEKKYFVECPNGSACVHPVKRCYVCSSGVTAGAIRYDDGVISCSDLLQLCETEGSKCNIDSMPLQQCGGEGCSAQECYRCLAAPNARLLKSCSICSLVRCSYCMEKEYLTADETIDETIKISKSNMPLMERDFVDFAEMLRKFEPNSLALCSVCGVRFCYSCMDEKSLQIVSRCIVDAVRNGMQVREVFCCSKCYWASKPCTNPNCPNEVGIPTKRCGGCHLDRYCSVECQVAMYPDHVGQCKKIQEKRTAAGKE